MPTAKKAKKASKDNVKFYTPNGTISSHQSTATAHARPSDSDHNERASQRQRTEPSFFVPHEAAVQTELQKDPVKNAFFVALTQLVNGQGSMLAALHGMKADMARMTAAMNDLASAHIAEHSLDTATVKDVVERLAREVNYYLTEEQLRLAAALANGHPDVVSFLQATPNMLTFSVRKCREVLRKNVRSPLVSLMFKELEELLHVDSDKPEDLVEDGLYRTDGQDDYLGSGSFRAVLVKVYPLPGGQEADPDFISHITPSQLALFEIVTQRWLCGHMQLPQDTGGNDVTKSAYASILAALNAPRFTSSYLTFTDPAAEGASAS